MSTWIQGANALLLAIESGGTTVYEADDLDDPTPGVPGSDSPTEIWKGFADARVRRRTLRVQSNEGVSTEDEIRVTIPEVVPGLELGDRERIRVQYLGQVHEWQVASCAVADSPGGRFLRLVIRRG